MLLNPTSSAPEPLHTTTKFNVYTGDEQPSKSGPPKPAVKDTPNEEQATLTVPAVKLEYDEISSAMAARLATSVLCHVLFLKSQIPFPIVQLSRMPSSQAGTRAGKKREELINAVDTLSSHLQTTFITLSAALAQRQKRLRYQDFAGKDPSAGRVCVAYVLGPSVGAAKARVLFIVDGLERKQPVTHMVQNSVAETEDKQAEAAQFAGECQPRYFTADDSNSGSGSDTEDSASEACDEEYEDTATPPPPSRSPSPSPSPNRSPDAHLKTPPPAEEPSPPIKPFIDEDTCASPQTSSKSTLENGSPLTLMRPLSSSSPLAEKRTALPSSHTLSENMSPLSSRQSKPSSPLTPKTVAREAAGPSTLALSENTPPLARRALGQRTFGTPLSLSPAAPRSRPALAAVPAKSMDEEQQALRAADRLLSRTLADACAEADGGLSAELAPTQMHVLLRAPRGFMHPAWVPRQNLTRTLDTQLDAFLEDVVVPPSDAAEDPAVVVSRTPPKPKKYIRTGVKTEGVWVCPKDGPRLARSNPNEPVAGESAEVCEEEEMIWWAWDGKIAGFSEW
ncbi:uncharacterized protein PHACADRAFT_181001 [Phanerochaete carnosa HHB-10118-sp]|uniref:Uncharacterized protein n=1 Tax=Phanerochaete carnosa (strain HHB-10118-sp) TaxID=650164 RepID=K5V857_PHACS|nr:uncharacterized protein PHACADRAFT_181001 [Phanerochaete carnosa HHB-10118-sp]EKM58966.1 hypothetical protein PHACADRAFT_181001 [Phanerochaete carnosa HHB-10118-sp]